jgi:uncharacterized protein (TIGR02147 family)
MERIEFYTDYRKYLDDFYNEQKKRHSYFSYRYFCNKAGLSSPALYTEVVKGQRNLTERTINSFIRGMGLTDTDGKYFRTLVRFNQAGSEKEKVHYLDQLRGLRARVKQKVVPLDLYDYYTTWYYPVIRELVCLLDWQDDYRLLARAVEPPVKKSDAQKAVRFLLDKGFLKIGSDGRYFQTNPALTTGSEVSSIAIRAFNEIMAQKGTVAIRKFPPSERDIRTIVAGVSPDTYPVIKDEIREFVSRIVRIVNDDAGADSVYSLNIQFFPLTRKSDNQGERSHENT